MHSIRQTIMMIIRRRRTRRRRRKRRKMKKKKNNDDDDDNNNKMSSESSNTAVAPVLSRTPRLYSWREEWWRPLSCQNTSYKAGFALLVEAEK